MLGLQKIIWGCLVDSLGSYNHTRNTQFSKGPPMFEPNQLRRLWATSPESETKVAICAE